MPSFTEIVGTIVTLIVLVNASGYGEWIWKGIAEVRHIALEEARRDWGCPSPSGKSACASYESVRYR